MKLLQVLMFASATLAGSEAMSQSNDDDQQPLIVDFYTFECYEIESDGELDRTVPIYLFWNGDEWVTEVNDANSISRNEEGWSFFYDDSLETLYPVDDDKWELRGLFRNGTFKWDCLDATEGFMQALGMLLSRGVVTLSGEPSAQSD